MRGVVPELRVVEVPTGTMCFDWSVPKEWSCTAAYIITPSGQKICDFAENNLHLVGYSTPVSETMTYDELAEHLHYSKEQPTAIPYVTSYYKERWGFCLSYEDFLGLDRDGVYTVEIASELKDGFLTYGEVLISGESDDEVLLSTYICHPSMANNELSGPVVTMALADFIKNIPNRRYSYRIVFIPETIGSICYLSKNLHTMKKRTVAGFNITTIGDNRGYSFVPTRYGNTLADKVARHVLKDTPYKEYSFLDRGSDERQYCSPGVDLPVATICRTKYGEYREYHTSLDNLDLVSPEGLYGGYDKLRNAIELLEGNRTYTSNILCEPQLGKRGLYPTLSVKGSAKDAITQNMMNLIAYADGSNDLIGIANIIGVNAIELLPIANTLVQEGVLQETQQVSV